MPYAWKGMFAGNDHPTLLLNHGSQEFWERWGDEMTIVTWEGEDDA